MRPTFGLLVLLVSGCAEETTRLHGPITVITQPGARVDFLSQAGVTETGIADASGSISSEVDVDDHVAISLGANVVVLDKVMPHRTYYWIPDTEPASPALTVTLTWQAPPGASYYLVYSRCGGEQGIVSSPAMITVCAGGDAVLVIAKESQNDSIVGAAYHSISAVTAGQSLALSASEFHDARSAGYYGELPNVRFAALSTLITPEGVRFDVPRTVWGGFGTSWGIALPPVPGTLRTELAASTDRVVATLLQQREIGATHESIQLESFALLELASRAMLDVASSTLHWQFRKLAGTRAVIAELTTTTGSLTLVTPCDACTSVTIPALPPDLGTITATNGLPTFASSSADYDSAEERYQRTLIDLGRRFEINHPPLDLLLYTAIPDYL